ncbi:hypothetical protein [Marinospirillum perlucidum]|uniref:hypothetical protein n=1 Tax=Marinospirillum perlucidum TaxID=1982602 RepID=UPI000DF11425|nr:hypothetical protein [Marinospirillum perlucidum]
MSVATPISGVSGELRQRPAASSPWQFWQFFSFKDKSYSLYALLEAGKLHPARALHLGVFDDPGSLAAQQVRFLDEPKTTVALELAPETLQAWLADPENRQAPAFVGQFGTAWSGYGLRPADDQGNRVEVIYAADRRHEWLGVFTQAEAFAHIELDYDRRRRRCLLC